MLRQELSAGWVCHDCDARIGPRGDPYVEDEVQAIRHAIDRDHWVYLHPNGDRCRPPVIEAHASDYGGAYVSPVAPRDARRLADDYRRRHSPSGAF